MAYLYDQQVWIKDQLVKGWDIAHVVSVLPAPQNSGRKKKGGGSSFDGKLRITVVCKGTEITIDKDILDRWQVEAEKQLN